MDIGGKNETISVNRLSCQHDPEQPSEDAQPRRCCGRPAKLLQPSPSHTIQEQPQRTHSGRPVEPSQRYISVLEGSGVANQFCSEYEPRQIVMLLCIILSCVTLNYCLVGSPYRIVNARRMRTRVTLVCLSVYLFVCLSVCLLPLYCLHRTFMQQNERTSQFCAKLQRFSTEGFR